MFKLVSFYGIVLVLLLQCDIFQSEQIAAASDETVSRPKWTIRDMISELKTIKKRLVHLKLEEEIKFCAECFVKINHDEQCEFCYVKYLYKFTKKIKQSSNYWYSRAGR